jgi:hypothetical protein
MGLVTAALAHTVPVKQWQSFQKQALRCMMMRREH